MKLMRFCFMVCSLFLFQVGYAASLDSPVGYWKTIDDVTGQPKAIMQLWVNSQNQLFGRVMKFFPGPGHDQNEVCKECTGSRHNQRIAGMVVLENMRQDKEAPLSWQGGTILDPKNGKSYHCNIQVIDNGKRLNVRGYIGLPLFGRTQTWIRQQDYR